MSNIDFNISTSKNLYFTSPNIIFGTNTTNISFPSNIFPTNTVNAINVVGITNFSDVSNVSSLIFNLSTSLSKGVNLSSTQANSLYGQNIVLSDDGSTVVIGSPYFDTTYLNAGRLDIYKNSTITTFYGDRQNAYFGQKIAVSPDGSTVLMGSPAYNGGRGIFHAYYNGALNLSVIGPDTNMSYGENLLIDSSGNSIMYTTAEPAVNTYWTYYNLSTNTSLVANPYQYSYNGGTPEDSLFNTSYNASHFQNLMTNGNISSYIINSSSNGTYSNISLVLANNRFKAIADGWNLTNMSSSYITTVNNTKYFAVLFFAETRLNVYIGNFLNTNQNYYNTFTLTPGPITAHMNSKNILTVNAGNVIKIFSITDTSTIYLQNNDILINGITSLAANASVLAVGSPSTNSLKVYNILSTQNSEVLNVNGSTDSLYGSKVAINSAGDVVVTKSAYTLDIYKNYSLNSKPYSIVTLPNLSYDSIAVNSSGVIATSNPYYNSGKGLVQIFSNINNLSDNISTNVSTNVTNSYSMDYKSTVVYTNGYNIMNTSYNLTTTNTVSNASSYVYNVFTNQMSFVGFSTTTQTASSQDVPILNIAYDTRITKINIGNPTNTITIGNVSLTEQTLLSLTTTSDVNLFTTTASTIHIGNATNSNHIGNIDITGQTLTAMNTASTVGLFDTNTGDIGIGTAQGVGNKIQIGGKYSTTQFGNMLVNYQTMNAGRAVDAVELFTTTTAIINIGNSANYNKIGNIGVIGQSITALTPGSQANLFTNTTDTVNIGNATNSNHIGNIDIVGQSIQSLTTTAPASLFTNTSTVTIGTGQGVGNQIQIGSATNTNQIGNVSIVGQTLTAPATAPVNLFTTATNAITIGNSTNSNKIGNVSIAGQTLTTVTPTDPVNLFTNNTGIISIGTAQPGICELIIGNSNNTNRFGGITVIGQTLTSNTTTNPVNLFTTTTGEITMGGVKITNNRIVAGTVAANTLNLSNYVVNNPVTNTNHAFGSNALSVNTAANNNAFGLSALAANTTGFLNSAFGNEALKSNTTARYNSAFGSSALSSNTTAWYNSAFGYNSLAKNTSGAANNAFGADALGANISGTDNNAFGNNALLSNTIGKYNSAFGSNSLKLNMSGNSNNAFGYFALGANTSGTQNNAVGNIALSTNTIGQYNNALGYEALGANMSGSSNNAVGYNSLKSNIASNNNAFGSTALSGNTTGVLNNAFGGSALGTNLTGSNSNAFGYEALYNNKVDSNSAFGHQTMRANTSGSFNSALGRSALSSNTVGSYNTAVGNSAIAANTSNSYSTALGAGTYINASYSTAIGYNASTSTNNQIVLGTAAETVYIPGILYAPNSIGNISSTIQTLNSSVNTITSSAGLIYNLSTTDISSLKYSNVSGDKTNGYLGQNIVLSRNGSTIAIGSPAYDSNRGRLDIYTDTVFKTTVIGDAVNSYFGSNIVVSDDGRTVLMGSPAYQSARGIFNQFYDGVLNFSVVGPATNMSYGANMYVDMSGNGIMFSNASVTNWNHYILYGISPTANMSLVANMSTSIYNATTVTATNFYSTGGYTTMIFFAAINIFGTNYRNYAFVTTGTTPIVPNTYYSTVFQPFRVPCSNRMVYQSTSSNANINYFNVTFSPSQPGWATIYVDSAYTVRITYFVSSTSSTETLSTATFTDTTSAISKIIPFINMKNKLMMYLPNINKMYIYTITGGTASINLYDTFSLLSSNVNLVFAYNANVIAYSRYSTVNNIIAVSTETTAEVDILRGTIPNTVYSDPITYELPNIAIDSSGQTVLASTSYNSVVQVYKNFNVANLSPLASVNISGIESYGQSIALNASGTILATSAPNYNNKAGLVQYLYLDRNISGQINPAISDTTYTQYNTSIDNVFKLNYINVVATNNNTIGYRTTTNTSVYNVNLGNASFIGLNTSVTTIETLKNTLTLAGDSSFTRVNIGGANTSTIVIGGNALSANMSGVNNTAIGVGTYINASYSTAIGYNASTSTNNQIVLGTAAETVYIPGILNAPSANITSVNVPNISSVSIQSLTANISTVNASNTSSISIQSITANISTVNANRLNLSNYVINNTVTNTNQAYGSGALSVTTGTSNNAFGYQALLNNTAGSNNNAFGYQALLNNTGGNYNSALGVQALSSTTGSNNTGIGSQCNITSGVSNSTVIGAGATTSTSNQIVLGTAAETVVIPGVVNAPTANIASVNASNVSSVSIQSLTANISTVNSSNVSSVSIQTLTANIATVNSSNVSSISIQTLTANISTVNANRLNLSNYVINNTVTNTNNAFGSNALSVNTAANNNAFGLSALAANTTGFLNSAFGNEALKSNTTARYNSAFGSSALASNTTAWYNSAFGNDALKSNTSGASNNAFGAGSLSANISGTDNNAFGNNALLSNTIGQYNSAFGSNSLKLNMSGNSNNAYGYFALGANTSGTQNNAFGNIALTSNKIGQYNNAFGYEALGANMSGSSNNAVGYNSLKSNIASNNNGFGGSALSGNTTGTLNNAFGGSALGTNLTGSNSNAFGYEALVNNKVDSNSAFGHQTLRANTSGSFNSALGRSALGSNTVGSYNTAVGDSAISANIANSYSTALGAGTFINASYSTAIGYNASTSTSNQIVLGTAAETVYIPGNLSTTSILTNNVSTNSTYLANQGLTTNVYFENTSYNFSTIGFTSLNASNFSGDKSNGYLGQNIVMSRNGSTIAIGSPAYDSNRGRLDIYSDFLTKVTTVTGDAVNSYFGKNLVVSDDGRSVLMGSPAYRGGCGIFHQYYNGERNFSVIGPATNMSYGANMYFDQSGNSVMFSNASVTSKDHYTIYGVSRDANASLVANVFTSVNRKVGQSTVTADTKWFDNGYKTFMYFIAINIFRTGSLYRNHVIATNDTTPRPGGPVGTGGLPSKGYVSSMSPFNPRSCFSDIAVLPPLDPSGGAGNVYNYFNVVLTPAQTGFVFVEVRNNSKTLCFQYYYSKPDGTGEIGISSGDITLPFSLDSRGVQVQVNNNNVVMIWIPSSKKFWIYGINNPTPTAPATPSLTKWWDPDVNENSMFSLAFNTYRYIVTGYQNNSTTENFKITRFYTNVVVSDDLLLGYIPNYKKNDDGTTTYYTPTVAIDSEGTTAVVSSPYGNVVQVYTGFSTTNKNPKPTSIIGVIPGINYGQTIAINASGTILATSAPNYNNNAGLVQYLYLNRNSTLNVSYITNISTQNTYNTYSNRIDSIFNLNNQTVLKETNISNIYVNTYNTSVYNISLGMNASLFRSYTNTSTTIIYNNTLTLGDDSSITRVNIGGENTNTIAIGTNALSVPPTGNSNTALGAYTNITDGASYSTVIGYGATSSSSNQIVLGRTTDSVCIPGSLKMTYSSYTIPTDPTQIGYTVEDPIDNTSDIPGSIGTTTFTNWVPLPAGVWLITYSLRLESTSGIQTANMNIYGQDNDGLTAYAQHTNVFSNNNNTAYGCTGTFVISSGRGEKSYNIIMYISYPSTPRFKLRTDVDIFRSYVQRTRIA